jgi:hypothetical protein
MTAVWTAPKSWSVNELVTAALLNTHLRDTLEFLKAPPTAIKTLDEASNYTTTSTTFVEVDGAGAELSLQITTAGGDVLIGFFGLAGNSTANRNVQFNVEVDGTLLVGDDGLISVRRNTDPDYMPVAFMVWKTGLSAGSHTFKLMWKVATGGGTGTLYAGAGTPTYADVHSQFWVREMS